MIIYAVVDKDGKRIAKSSGGTFFEKKAYALSTLLWCNTYHDERRKPFTLKTYELLEVANDPT